MSVRSLVAGFLRTADADTTTLKQVRKNVEASLGRDATEEERTLIKELATKWATEAAAPAAAPEPPPLSKEELALKQLRLMVKAIGGGPQFYKNLKDQSLSEQATTLRARLREAGAPIKGAVPTATEIKQAEKERDLKRDLDGIDTSLIIDSKRRRTTAPVASRTREEDDEDDEAEFEDDDDESENEDSDDADNEAGRSRKKAKKAVDPEPASKKAPPAAADAADAASSDEEAEFEFD